MVGGLKYLIDSNVFLELLLEQERADEVEQFFLRHATDVYCLTEFSLYSIGVHLIRRKQTNDFLEFVEDTLLQGQTSLLRISPDEMRKVISFAKRFNLDFDDAYQYTAAEKYNLQIVSFDSDFDRTERSRVTPQQVLESLNKPQ